MEATKTTSNAKSWSTATTNIDRQCRWWCSADRYLIFKLDSEIFLWEIINFIFVLEKKWIIYEDYLIYTYFFELKNVEFNLSKI